MCFYRSAAPAMVFSEISETPHPPKQTQIAKPYLSVEDGERHAWFNLTTTGLQPTVCSLALLSQNGHVHNDFSSGGIGALIIRLGFLGNIIIGLILRNPKE